MFYSFCKLTNNFSHIQIFKLKMRHSLLQFGSMPALAPLLQGNRAILAGIFAQFLRDNDQRFRKNV